MLSLVVGALAGWKWTRADNGVVLSVQLAPSTESFETCTFATVSMALNDRQLRSLARDIKRMAAERGLELESPPKLRGMIAARFAPALFARGKPRG